MSLVRPCARRLAPCRRSAAVLGSAGVALAAGGWLVRRRRPDPRAEGVSSVARALALIQGRLRDQEQARRTLVSTASHELRTPLASLELVLGLLGEQLESDRPDLHDARRQVAAAQRQADRLSGLAGSLLELSRLDAGLPLRREMLALDETCRAVIAEFRPLAYGVPIELAAPTRCWAVGDPGAVAHIVRNLLDNALQFASDEGAVRVDVGQHGAQALACVADDGPGVPQEDRERIFERFERGRDTADNSGFGLGLAIARELAQRMDGDVRLDDAGGGSGARFLLILPAAPPDELEDA